MLKHTNLSRDLVYTLYVLHVCKYLGIGVRSELVLAVLLEDQPEDLPGLAAALVFQQRLPAQVLRQVALALHTHTDSHTDSYSSNRRNI